jgi:hypothetical protein
MNATRYFPLGLDVSSPTAPRWIQEKRRPAIVSRAHYDLAYVHIVGFINGVRHRARHRVRRHGKLFS